MAERKIRGVLFDMDGLLVDSERVGAQVMIDAARRQNVPVSLDVVKSTLGTTLEKCREIYARHYPALQYEPLRQDFCEEMHRLARAGGIPLKPGAKALLDALHLSAQDVRRGGIPDIDQKAETVGLPRLAADIGVGLPTLRDMIAELKKPGRDPRDDLPKPVLRTDVMDIKDLTPGMELTGTVRNVIDFGAFVDIGVHQDGLVHISRMADRFIRHPSEVVKVGDVVRVWVVDVDVQKKRIALTMVKGRT